MNLLSQYLIQSVIGLILFYLVYAVFLRKQTFFAINRFFLIGAVFFSLIIPLFSFSMPVKNITSGFGVMLDTIQINGSFINDSISMYPDVSQLILGIYLTGITIFSIRFIIQVSQLILLIRKYGVTRSEGINFVFTDRNYSPFSFFNIIFLNNKNVTGKDIENIIAHEQVHVKQYHSADLILLEILTIIHWFNPIIWFYRYSLKAIHEFLADEGVLLKGYNRINYQNLLVSQIMGIQVNDLTNNFNHSLIKKRLIMMKMAKPGKWAKLRVLLSIPVLYYALVAFTGPAQNSFTIINSGIPEITEIKSDIQKNDSIYQNVEVMPVFSQGGEKGLIKYISENVSFPTKSKKEGIQAKVYINFVVNEKGNVQDVAVIKTNAEKPDKNGKMIQCNATELEDEAIRVIKSLPSFIPGKNNGKAVKVAFTIPINFKLD